VDGALVGPGSAQKGCSWHLQLTKRFRNSKFIYAREFLQRRYSLEHVSVCK
jgi:hypothetical protein